jgi:hypothetical protein
MNSSKKRMAVSKSPSPVPRNQVDLAKLGQVLGQISAALTAGNLSFTPPPQLTLREAFNEFVIHKARVQRGDLHLSRNHAVAIEATVGADLWAYEKAHQVVRRIGSPNSDRIH